MNDITAWLAALDLQQYAALFANNDIDFELLTELSDRDLREIGIDSLGHRRKLLKAIAALSGEAGDASRQGRAADPARDESGPERRQITVMFCDMVGSTSLSVQLDPEELREVIAAYQNCCERVIAQFDGYIAKFLGDGVLVYFGYPQATEHDPERAVRAGLEVVAAVAQLRVLPELILRTRVGIATGEVVVGDLIGERAAQERTVIGETPNLAARLQALAEPNTVVIGAHTRRLVGELFDYIDLGRHPLHGYAEPVPAWRVVSERTMDSRFEATHKIAQLTPLIGRERELGYLLQRWRQAAAGAGQVVLVSSEPGIGKSRLIHALREQLGSEQHTLLRYFCAPYYQNSSFFPVINQIGRAARFGRDDSAADKLAKLEALLASGGGELAQTVPVLASLLSLPTGDRYPPLRLSPQRQRENIMQTLTAQLAGLAEHQPVLLIFEDLHWVDPTTLELLERLVAQVQTLPVMLLMTSRPEFSAPWRGAAHITALNLNRLDREDSVAMIDRLTGGKALPKSVLEQILSKTDGVPLFIEELLKTVLEAQSLEDAGDHYVLLGALPSPAIPSTLQDSLMARLDRLNPVKRVAQIGAALGRQFSYDLLAAVASVEEPALQDALAQLSGAELIYRRNDTSPDISYTFKHALVQDAAYNTLLRGDRQQLHAHIARVLEQRFPDTVQNEPELLAHHYSGAGNNEQAIAYLQKAALQAIQRSANTEAIEYLHKGLGLLDTLPDANARTGYELGLQIILGPPLLATRGFAAPEVEAAYARARELCEQVEDASQLFPVMRGLMAFYSVRADLETARSTGEQLLGLAGRVTEPAYELEAHWTVGSNLLYLGEFSDAREHLEQGGTLYDPARHHAHAYVYGQDPGVSSLSIGAYNLWFLGYPEQALAQGREALALAQKLGHPFSLAQAGNFLAFLFVLRREIEPSAEQAQALLELSTEQGFPLWAALATVVSGWARAQRRDEDGIAEIAQGLATYHATGAKLAQSHPFAMLSEAHAGFSQVKQGLAIIQQALAAADVTGEKFFSAELQRLKGELLLMPDGAGTVGEAEACFQQALAIAHKQKAKSFELRAATSLARRRREQGRYAEAYALLAPLHGWFSEGFDCADLRQSQNLLGELRGYPESE